jgi:uracil-DNA glycosylase family 4
VRLKFVLNELHKEIDACEVCRARGQSIIKSVGIERGDLGSRIMGVGIAPSTAAHESKKAFAGNSFSRLSKWFAEAGFPASEAELRKAIYLTSLNKCAVTPDTMANRKLLWSRCQQFLWRQIEIIQPELILLLGIEVASVVLSGGLRSEIAVGKRWTTQEIFGQDLFPTTSLPATWLLLPHPSGLNRTMNDKAIYDYVIASLRTNLTQIAFGYTSS